MQTVFHEHSALNEIDGVDVRVGVRGDYGIWLTEVDVLQFVNLRGDITEPGFVEEVNRAASIDLPTAPNTVTRSGDVSCHWLGPDEWLITVTEGGKAIGTKLCERLAGCHVAVTDLTGGQVLLRIGGQDARDVLSSACTLDLHPAVFAVGGCAQTLLAHVVVLITPVDQGAKASVFDIVVRRSFADHLARWLIDAAREGGCEFRPNRCKPNSE